MIPDKLKVTIEKYCMGHKPTEMQENEIIDMAVTLKVKESSVYEIISYIDELAKGPTIEEIRAREAAEERARKIEEANKRAEEIKKKKQEKIISIIRQVVIWTLIIAAVIFVGYWIIYGIRTIINWVFSGFWHFVLGAISFVILITITPGIISAIADDNK